MAVFIVLWPYLLNTKLRSVIRHNIGHSKLAAIRYSIDLRCYPYEKKVPKFKTLLHTLKREFSGMYMTTKKVAQSQTPCFGVLEVHTRGTY